LRKRRRGRKVMMGYDRRRERKMKREREREREREWQRGRVGC